MNNKFEIVHSFDLYKTYNDTILKLILGDVFDDVIVISGVWLYIFGYDLRLKTRIKLTAKTGERFAIKGLDVLKGLKNGVETKLLNYPYDNEGIELSKEETEKVSKSSSTVDFSIPLTDWFEEIEKPRFINHKNVHIAKNSGSIIYSSNLATLITESNSMIYKNNLYVPMDSKILKIIFCPDKDKDFEMFVSEEEDFYNDNDNKYPAAARFLTSDEFVLNYQNSEITGKNNENISLEGGFIQVDNKIKNIFIDEDGKIYALNFDKIGVSIDGDTIYGLYGEDKYLATGQWFWLFNQSMSKM